MSIVISNIALHFLSKKEDTGEVVLRLGPENADFAQESAKTTNFVDGLQDKNTDRHQLIIR